MCVATVEGSLLVSFSVFGTECRKATGFCMLGLYPATWLNMSVGSEFWVGDLYHMES